MRTTPQERQALGVTALLLVAGAGVRIFSASAGEVQWEGMASDTVSVGGVGAVRAGAEAELARERIRATPLAPGERIDPNRADALQLDRLPRVGAAMAERIVAWRGEHGPFRTLADLDAVPGVGPTLLASLAPHLTLPPAPPRAPRDRATGAKAAGSAVDTERVDLNRATEAELEALPGIGPALAARIVASREEHGRFARIGDLARVPGIGPALLERLAPLVTVSGRPVR
ncbi:MAG TPA: helix-hairpin-helix domain-containing protein [Longimicrobiaceae bacterium]